MARARKTASSVKVNFKGVESRRTPPEGDYPLEILEAKLDKGPSGEMIAFVLEISKGEYKGTKLYFYCPLAENSLWKLHAFLTAMGEEVPEDEMDIDLSDLIGKEVTGVLTHETYQGKKRAKMTDFDSIDNYSGDAGEEEDEPKKGKKKSKKSDDEEEDEAPKKKGKKSKKSDDDEDEEDEPKKKGKKSKKDEEDEEDEPKAKKGKGKKSKKKTWSTEDIEDMDEDELQEVLEEAGLEDEVDLDDHKKLKKKVAAVLEALEEADLLSDD